MNKLTRRAVFGMAAASGLTAAGTVAQDGHKPHSLSGPLANATVSFGEWKTEPPLDRFLPFDITTNGHHLLPAEVKIRAGGAVNYIIAGFHLIAVYDDGTDPGDIDVSMVIPESPPFPPLIDDPANRIYRGLDPRTQPLDRVEVVHFPEPGTYLVICGVLPHFVFDNMFGYVRVLP